MGRKVERSSAFLKGAIILLAALGLFGGSFETAEAAKRSTRPPSGGFTASYASTQCSDFINPAGSPRVPTATCTRRSSTLSGTDFVHDAEVTPLAGAGFSYGWAASGTGFALENVKMPANSLIPVSVSLHVSTAEVFGTGLSTPGSATVIASLWISGCFTSQDYKEAVIATSEQDGKSRSENLGLTLTAYCRTDGESLHTVYFDVDSVAILNEGCSTVGFASACGFVPGAGPLRATAAGSVGSVTIG